MFPSYALSPTIVAGPTARRAGERCDSVLSGRGGAVQGRLKRTCSVMPSIVEICNSANSRSFSIRACTNSLGVEAPRAPREADGWSRDNRSIIDQ